MVNLNAQFDKAVTMVRSLPPDGEVKPTQDQQLEVSCEPPCPADDSGAVLTPDSQFYANFKQATEGDVSGPAPGAFNFTAKYKYNAWKKLEGTSKDAAKEKYVALLKGVSRAGAERTRSCRRADADVGCRCSSRPRTSRPRSSLPSSRVSAGGWSRERVVY